MQQPHDSWEHWVEPSTNTSHSSLSDDREFSTTRSKQPRRPYILRTQTRTRTKGIVYTSKATKKVPNRKDGGDGKARTDNQDNDQIDQYILPIKDLTLDSVKVFQGVTPAEFASLSEAIDDLPIRVKFTYLPESEELHVMSPSQLHEASIIHFSTVVERFICNLHIPFGMLNVELNSKIQKPIPMIPDFMCTLTHKPSDYAVKWAGEVSFAVSPSATRKKMMNLLADTSTIDLAFIIYLKETHKWTAPDEESRVAIKLRSRGLIPREDFLKPYLADEFYEKVDVGDFTWVSLGKMSFEVFLRHPIKGFDLQSTDTAYRAKGSFYPVRQMDDVGRLFETGAQSLKTSAIALLEKNYGNPTPAQILKLQKARSSNATLDLDWDEWANSVSQRLCCTAYERYYQWFVGPSIKRKSNLQDPSHGPSGSGRGKKRVKDGKK